MYLNKNTWKKIPGSSVANVDQRTSGSSGLGFTNKENETAWCLRIPGPIHVWYVCLPYIFTGKNKPKRR